MMRKDSCTTAIAVLFAFALFIPAQAEPITFTFGGTITEILDDNNFLDGALNIGDDFFGSYTFESATPDIWPGDPTLGSYWDSIVAIEGFVGALHFQQETGSSGKVVVADDFWSPPYDSYGAGSERVVALNVLWSLGLKVTDPTAEAFDSDAICLEPPSLSLFETRSFSLYSEAENVAIRGAITSLLPEPGSLLVLTFGSIGLVSRRRRGIPRESGLQ